MLKIILLGAIVLAVLTAVDATTLKLTVPEAQPATFAPAILATHLQKLQSDLALP